MVSTVLPRVARPPTADELTLHDVEAVRLLLRGDSVIDWHRLAFSEHAEVDRFLRLNEFDPGSDDEMTRLEDIRSDAVDHLSRVYQMAIPDEVAADLPARDLFLVASSDGPHQKWACVVLKLMHIIHHINGRAGLLKMSVSDEIIFREIELKVMQVVEQLRAAGAPLAEWEWSRKPRDSQITKLLAKRSTLAANIYDKLRFRLIVPTRDDLVPMLATLTRQLIPFNYVVPGESLNQLVDLEHMTARAADTDGALGPSTSAAITLTRMVAQTQPPPVSLSSPSIAIPTNEFSGPEYRIVNFVADLPLRIDRLLPRAEIPPELSHVVFVLTEFQIADKATAIGNEQGASSHEAYKARQHERVRMRLFRDKDDPIPD
ncbi:MAG: TIGR04552 family protein [Deltaproteobacteria bacterium]|nr:TIGR04552 family protein [Deltaproteobacteria bacterium]MCW5801136.1 TIGR04552 family protein [Deltaproteobacteria bacterium]